MAKEAGQIRVLLVEDDDEDAQIFCRHIRQLVRQEVAVTRADCEEDAQARIADEEFDLIFVDLNIGERGSGMTLLRYLEEQGVETPAIVVTGSGDELKAVEAMKLGAYDYLVKGNLSADLLERTIKHVRERHALERERADMVEQLAELSVTDELTGLANRRRLTQRLDEEISRAERGGHSFAVLMIDLDHFKQVNDSYGHQVGDEVLKQCAEAFEKNLRAADFVARYGGEEFCVLMPETRKEGACQAGERLREAIKALPAPVPTISVGVALWRPGLPAERVVREADEALYKAKEAGRDRTVLYEE